MTVGVVVIGRNSERTLGGSLASVCAQAAAIVYADSGSSDGSTAMARAVQVEVVALDDSQPHTAARGRNEGFRRLIELHPEVEFVQFLDGDCFVEPGWLAKGAAFLAQHDEVGVLAGRLRERDRERNVYHRLADMEWDTPDGDVDATGGNMMVRREVWQRVDGMHPGVAAGEEAEFCLRVRAQGYRIVKIAEPMATHDIGMDHFADWWRRAVRFGRATAESTWRRGPFDEGSDLKRLLSSVGWGGVIPLSAMAAAPITLGASLGGAVALYAMLWRRVRRERLRHGDRPDDAALYATFCVGSKFAECLGTLSFARWKRTQDGGRTPLQHSKLDSKV